jgi:histidinol-phosphate phosphatase family protein
MKALFFDRDGTLIHDAGYLSNPDEVKYFDDTFEALERMKKLGFGFFIVTNQSGVGRGYFKEDCILKVHEKMQKDFQSNGLNLFDIAYCPHSP